MKRLSSFLCLFLCLCILFPVFSISLSAAEIDGNTVYTYWYVDDLLDLTVFDNTIVTRSKPSDFNIYISVILSSPIKKHTTFDVDLSIISDSFSSSSVEVTFFDDNTKLVDTVNTEIVNGKISISTLQFDSVISRINYKIHISNANWTVIETLHDFTIDGSLYHCEDSQTWSAWCNSSYNTLGLFVDNGKIYKGDSLNLFILKLGDNSVSSSDYVLKDTSYTLEPAGVATTKFNFYIDSTKYTCESGMTWSDWLVSSYNTNGFITDGDYIYNSNMTKILVKGGFLVFPSSSIINDGRYNLSDYTVDDSSYALYQYEFNFSVNSLDFVIHDEGNLLNSIFYYLKKLLNGITDLASNISSLIASKLEELFIPNDDRILEIKEEFEEVLRGRFGVLFDSVDIVDMVADTFVYKGTTESIILPSVTVNLVGVPFTFGGYEVDVIPDGFEDLVEALKIVVNITCTWWFVLAMKKRLEEVLS